ncbi:MAG: ABC transporter ATP-binding protein [Eubacteriales bacterium]
MIRTRLGNIVHLTKYLKNYSNMMITSILVGFLYRILPIVLSFLLSYIIGMYTTENSTKDFGIYFSVLFVIILLLGVGRYVDCIYSHDVAYRILADLRIKLYYKIEQLSPAFLKSNRSGNILSIIMEDVNLLEWFYAHTFGVLFITIMITLGVLGFLYWLHPVFVLILLCWILALFLVHYIFGKVSESNGMEIRNNLGHLESELTDGIHGIKDIVSFRFEEGYRSQVKQVSDYYEKSCMKDGHRKGVESSMNRTIMAFASIHILYHTALFIQQGMISSEWYLVTIVISSAVWRPISEFLSMAGNLGLISSAAGRVVEILEEEPLVKEEGEKELILSNSYEIVYDNVTFSYPEEEDSVLKGISCTIQSGETVAISGVSGAGKSTLGNLLLRFYEVSNGTISINGSNIREFSLSTLRNEIAVVPQEIYLFHTSIWENIKISKPNASKEEIINVLELSGAQEFVSELPQGYDTIVGERGARLSGGQKQRIAIARALLKNSKILILDEASSNLDYSSEQHFNTSLQELKKERTTIMIAHRLSMLQTADRILYMEDGMINDVGTFTELEQRNSGFRKMIGGLR